MNRFRICFFIIFCSCFNLRAQLNSGISGTDTSSGLIVGNPDSASLKSVSLEERYKDGIYCGVSPEWTGMTVEVKVKNGKIEDLRVVKAKGTPEYYEPVLKQLPRAIKKAGNVEVDGISGATLSSNSLKAAVLDALKKALIQ